MKSKVCRREMIFDVVRNQMKNNDPPETNLTYKRLRDIGYSDSDTLQLIGKCIAVEIFKVMKFKEPYNPERYVENLNRLPEEPFNDEKD